MDENITLLKEYLIKKKFHNAVTSHKHILKKFPFLNNHIIKNTDLDFSGQLYCLINDIKYPICVHCNHPHLFVSFKKGFLKSCNNKCEHELIEYNGIFFKKTLDKVLVCEKHNKYISLKIFNGLIQHNAECLCEACSLELQNLNKCDESIAEKTKKYFSKLFLDRKRFSTYYIKTYYPNFYSKIISITDIKTKNFDYKLNYYLFSQKRKCKTPSCDNIVNTVKNNNDKEYCLSCQRKINAQKHSDNFTIEYWHEYIKNNFNKDIKDFKIEEENLVINNFCEHRKTLKIKKSRVKFLKKRGIHSLCDECNKLYYSQNVIENIEIINVLKNNWKFIKTISYEKLLYYNPILWVYINNLMKKKKLGFSEAKYMLKYDIKERPKCLCCNNDAIFSTDAYAFLTHCEQHKFDYKTSTFEQEVNEFLDILHLKYNRNVRDVIHKEIDFYFSDLNLGIECNGIYWHSENFRSPSYHINKLKMCKEKNIKLITIWEDDWKFKQEIVKSIIKNSLGLTENKIYARNTEIKILDNNEKRLFLEKNHLQGNVNANINIGLYYDDELISLMSFGKKRMVLKSKSLDEYEYELLRFCSKLNTNVIGGASKLFSHFINNYKPKSIISYANCDISNGNLYEKLGFKFISHTGLNYWWAINGKKYHRSNFMKHKLVREGEDPNKSEDVIMRERGYLKIYGSGNLKYEWIK